MEEDVALVQTTNGKWTFVWNGEGNVAFDRRGVYPVITTLLTHRGQYSFDDDGTQGSLLHTVKQDKLATASQIKSYAQEALLPLVANGLLSGFSLQVSRQKTGPYLLQVEWTREGARQPYTEQVGL